MQLRQVLGILLGMYFTAGVATARVASQDDGWRLRLTPYLWAPSVDGTLKVDGDGGDAEEEGGSALDYLSGAAMLSIEARRGDWSILGDFVWASFDMEGTLDGPLMTPFEASNEEVVVGLAAARTIARGESGRVDGVFGLRYLHADVGVDPQGGTGLDHSASANQFDPFLGLRGHFGGDSGLFGNPYGDVGGFGISSDLTWQLIAGSGWAWDWGDVQLGWRAIGYDFEDGGLLYDLTASGPFLAVSFQL